MSHAISLAVLVYFLEQVAEALKSAPLINNMKLIIYKSQQELRLEFYS